MKRLINIIGLFVVLIVIFFSIELLNEKEENLMNNNESINEDLNDNTYIEEVSKENEEISNEYISNNIRLKVENLYIINNKDKFNKGTFNNTEIVDENGKDVIALKTDGEGYYSSGIYESEVIDVSEFHNLIVSWNVETPEDTYVEVEARAYIETNDTGVWSDWLSWGKWGTNIERASESNENDNVKIDTDVLAIKGNSKEKLGVKLQIRVNLYSADNNLTPILRQLTATYKNINEMDKDIEVYNNVENIEVIVETPTISQMIRETTIAKVICSPTSLTMLLNRLGENLIVEDVASKTYDYEYEGYGNWVYNIAFAGSLGYEAYIQYGDLDILKSELTNGYPVAVSVAYTNDMNNSEYPYIENAPTTTGGHLIVVCGMEIDANGESYVVVNDPAANDDESVRLSYRLVDFLKAWNYSNNIMYIVH